jgi:hypothetical protein
VSRKRRQRLAETTGRPELRESQSGYQETLTLLLERISELEFALEEEGWTRLSDLQNDREFSREALTRIIRQSRLMYLKNPIVNRAVNVQAYYVWAQGVNIQAKDPAVNEVVQGFLDDPANRAELTSHQARTLKECDLQVLGNLFFVFFTDKSTGAVKVRTIPVEEVAEIVTDPEDAKSPWFYKRVYTPQGGQQKTVYYPDWRLERRNVAGGELDGASDLSARNDDPAAVLPQGAKVEWNVPVYHVRVGALSDMRFGLPETYQALDWARAYKEFLEDRATISRALSRFVFQLTTQGGAKGVAAAKDKLKTTLGVSTSETNPPPTAGAAFIAAAGNKLETMKVSGATINPEEGRRFLLMVAAAVGLPETFFGDVSTGNLATAKSLDRPTELKFLDRRTLWADVFKAILAFVIEQRAQAMNGKLPEGKDRTVEVSFPDLLERDVEARIRAVISAATLDGKEPVGTMDDHTLARLLLSALGIEDLDELLKKIAPEDGESLLAKRRAEKQQMAQAIAKQGQGEKPGQGDDEQGDDGERDVSETDEAMVTFVEAVRELRAAIAEVMRRAA